MSYGVREHDAIVFVDAARLPRLAHTAHIRQTESPNSKIQYRERERRVMFGCSDMCFATNRLPTAYLHTIIAADVFACDQNGHVVMMRIKITATIQVVLPTVKLQTIKLSQRTKTITEEGFSSHMKNRVYH